MHTLAEKKDNSVIEAFCMETIQIRRDSMQSLSGRKYNFKIGAEINEIENKKIMKISIKTEVVSL